ncbi:DNA polymerase epsilon subunit 4 [Papilio machaon]|uniref:DNA polymerase epsilon subunit 4 n=1 Tax=Papilio machaon TaxID=76193 RepID=UPI001E66617E|nr:DNA polymerase epsilon subunit 4 [Papilio machaon]
MMDESHLTELNMSEEVYDTDQFFTTDNQNSENFDSNLELNSEQLEHVDEKQTEAVIEKKTPPQRNETTRTKLPIARIRNIMRMDPDVSIVHSDAVFLVTKATELFLETMAKEAHTYMSLNKRKTIAKKDLDHVINNVDCLCFLEGAMDF